MADSFLRKIVFNMESNFNLIPVLIYAPRKSGSTLLHNLLDGHSQIVSIPGEVKLKRMIVKFKEDLKDRNFFKWFTENVSSFQYHESYTEEQYLENVYISIGNIDKAKVQEVIRVDDFLKEFMAAKPTKNVREAFIIFFNSWCKAHTMPVSNKKYILFKEVGGNSIAILMLFKTIFPNGKIILNSRDTYYVVRSIIRDRKKNGHTMSFKEVMAEFREANEVNKAIKAMGTNQFSDTLEIKYEDVVGDTEKWMRKICKFLDIEFEKSLLSPSMFGYNVIVNTSSKHVNTVFNDQLTQHWSKGLSIQQKLAFKMFWIISKLNGE